MKYILISTLMLIASFSAIAQNTMTITFQDNSTQSFNVSNIKRISWEEITQPTSDHEAVDLGLSVKWATCNVGADAPEEYGSFFAWGETSTKVNYDSNDYKYYNSSTKSYTDIGGNITGTEYDVAHVQWGGNWRMPTYDEMKELIDKCDWYSTTKNGRVGYEVTGPTGKSIFLPASGYRHDGETHYLREYGFYWTSTLYLADQAYNLDGSGKGESTRSDGLTVRPVISGGNGKIITTCSFSSTSYVTKVGKTLALSFSTNSNGAITYTSSDSSIASVDRLTGVISALSEGIVTITANVSATNIYEASSASCVITVKSSETSDYDYVDLGLSVKWATCNVGASSPEDYGNYFAWGETTGYNEGKTSFSWSTYTLCNGSYDTQTKYCKSSSYGTVDNKTVLESSDDAATANWGGSWRMPTDAELTELRTECTWTWTTQNGVKGYKVTSKTNGNSIFLPAAGCRNDYDLINAGSAGYYWSSSLYSSYSDGAYSVYFNSSNVGRYYSNRYYGRSVRPVCQ